MRNTAPDRSGGGRGRKEDDSDFLEEGTLNLAMLATDRQLNASRDQAAIRKLFVDRGILKR